MPRARQRPSPDYRLYVVELGKCPAPDGRIPVYVGSTRLSASQRLAVHTSGLFTSVPRVRRCATRLLEELFVDLPTYATRAEAERAEHALALELTRRGYLVHGGSGRPMPTRASLAGGAPMARSRKSAFTGSLKTTKGDSAGVRVPKKSASSIEVWLRPAGAIRPAGAKGPVPKIALSQEEALKMASWLLNAVVTASTPPKARRERVDSETPEGGSSS